MRKLFFLLLTLLVATTTEASHIVGGEIHYQYLGSDNYRIIIKIYRDCYNGQVGFDDPLPLTIFDASGNVLGVLDLTLHQPTDTLDNNASNPCLITPPNICVEEGLYDTIINLPPQAGGYILSYQRCCRNASISNISNPGGTGATYTAYIPGPPFAGNSDPSFTNFPPTVICNHYPLHFDHSATDADGDSLVYALCEPYVGGDATTNLPDPATPPPYSSVTFINPYSYTNPMGGNPQIALDSTTGMLTGVPTNLGQYVVGVCAYEYRNGQLLSVHRRDFQFNVANCEQSVVANTAASLYKCGSKFVAFSDSSIGAHQYHWNFGTSNPMDTSSLAAPSFTYPAFGTYTATLVVNPGSTCSDTANVNVNLIDTAAHHVSPNTTIFLGQSTEIAATSGVNYLWQPDSTLNANNVSNPIATPTVTTTYTVIITYDSACVVTDSVIVFVDQNPYIIFPNAFTPNGDGLNDLFRPYHYGFLSVEHFRIYNRWGQLVFDANNLNGWDGRFNGKEQEIGTYAYYLQVRGSLTNKEFEYQGNFTLIR